MFLGGISKTLTALAVGLGVALTAPAPVQADEMRLSRPQARQYGFDVLKAGHPQVAREVAQVLLRIDPKDPEALILAARTELVLGNPSNALQYGQRAHRAARTPEQSFAAAHAIAQSHYRMGNLTRSQLWLRRAAQVAPTDQTKAGTVRDFRNVRAQNPWSTRVSFSAGPVDNINGGSNAEKSVIYLLVPFLSPDPLPFEQELTGTARALSGTQRKFSLQTSYRFSQSNTHRARVFLDVDHTSYTLSDEAKTIAPTADASDYSLNAVNVGLEYETVSIWPQAGLTRFSGSVGTIQRGGDTLYNSFKLGAEQQFTLEQRGLSYVAVNRELQMGQNGREDTGIWSLRSGVAWRTDFGTLRLSVAGTRSQSNEISYDYHATAVNASVSLPSVTDWLSLDLGLELEKRVYDQSIFTLGARRDDTRTAFATARFDTLEFYGFVPTLTYYRSKTDSNAAYYNGSQDGWKLDIASSF